MESVEDLAIRLSDQCRDLINEEITKYFAGLLAESGQRTVRVVNIKKPARRKSPKFRQKSKARLFIEALEDGPQLTSELEKILRLPDTQALYGVVAQAKNLLKNTKRVIRCERGNKNKSSTYALRDVDDQVEEEKQGELES